MNIGTYTNTYTGIGATLLKNAPYNAKINVLCHGPTFGSRSCCDKNNIRVALQPHTLGVIGNTMVRHGYKIKQNIYLQCSQSRK